MCVHKFESILDLLKDTDTASETISQNTGAELLLTPLIWAQCGIMEDDSSYCKVLGLHLSLLISANSALLSHISANSALLSHISSQNLYPAHSLEG